MALAQNDQQKHSSYAPFMTASVIQFDKLPHRRLLTRLEYYGIRGSLLNRFKSFLTQRTQSVGASSAHGVTSSGVPQETVTGNGPLLFLIAELLARVGAAP